MLSGANIICFAKDWSEDPTSNNHVMKLLSRQNRVLWLNSIAMRTPSLKSSRDLRKIFAKLRHFSRGPELVEPGMWVYTPIVLPFPHSKLASRLNRWILRATLALLRRKLNMRTFQLWTFLPTSVEYVGQLGESLVVYYCTDEWSQFSYLDGQKMATMERRLCEQADLVFATAGSLVERRRAFNPETYLASHGVDHAHFALALSPQTRVASELLALPKPVIGFIGLIEEWIDQDLIAHVAERHPEWSIVLVGKAAVDVSRLARLATVHLLGRRPYADLPAYCKGFSAGIIPFVLNELTRHVNPIKLREYLSAGLPVVTTPLPEVVHYAEHASIAREPQEFLAALERAVAEDTPTLRERRSERMRKETWEHKVAEIGDQVNQTLARRQAPTTISG
jgi:glycosyltransferase involved in cell wall biosynthesis